AQRADVPTVAVYQTDVPGYTARYGMPFLESVTWQLLRDVHNRATVNLAPSNATRDQMLARGIERVQLWRRGVDTSLFSPSLRSARRAGRAARPPPPAAPGEGARARVRGGPGGGGGGGPPPLSPPPRGGGPPPPPAPPPGKRGGL